MRNLAPILLLVAVAACGPKDRVAKIGDTVLVKADVDVAAARVGQDRALDDIVESTLLFEGAKREKLLDDYAARARAEAAYRQALGDLLVEKALADATTDAALRARFERERESLRHRRIHIAQIFVKTGPEASAKMSSVLARLRAGEAFDAVARELSEDGPSAAHGGELPPIEEGHTDAAIFDAAAKLKKGERSDVVSSSFGMHLFFAFSDPETVDPSFDQARGTLAAQAMKDAKAALLSRLKSEIDVKIDAASKKTAGETKR